MPICFQTPACQTPAGTEGPARKKVGAQGASACRDTEGMPATSVSRWGTERLTRPTGKLARGLPGGGRRDRASVRVEQAADGLKGRLSLNRRGRETSRRKSPFSLLPKRPCQPPSRGKLRKRAGGGIQFMAAPAGRSSSFQDKRPSTQIGGRRIRRGFCFSLQA